MSYVHGGLSPRTDYLRFYLVERIDRREMTGSIGLIRTLV